ncbi:VNG_1110C family protein [Natronoarchaeum rubrum]|uniref:VNG_1110C family protein n=1 Tax=Natronoarchaeum rubrum TaxID=755311 RepID=UPI002112FFC7|nr:hypothetical protein [Natronoarchaeum rubrum]HMB49964.1 hypothetical protein [Natronoarchaeum rubrum]
MPDPSRLRDSTQIVLPTEDLDGLREEIESRFVVTIVPEGERLRIIGSPVEIKEAGEFLAKHGVRLP